MGQFYIMHTKKPPTIINCVEELKKFCICGSGKNLYISNLMPLKIVETFIAIMDEEMEITIFDHREMIKDNSFDLKKNGRTKIKLNKKYEIWLCKKFCGLYYYFYILFLSFILFVFLA